MGGGMNADAVGNLRDQNIPVTKKNRPKQEMPRLTYQRNLFLVRMAMAEMAMEIWNNVTALA
jgi:hypothetical protein